MYQLIASFCFTALARADVRPPVKIRMPHDTPVAMREQIYSGVFEVEVGRGGFIDDIQIDGRGWKVTAIDRSQVSNVAAAGTLHIPFQAVPENPDNLVRLSFTFDGRLVSRSFYVGPEAAARRGRDSAAIQVEPGEAAPPGADHEFSNAASGPITLRFKGRLIYDRPVLLDGDNMPTGGTVPVGVDGIWVEVIDEDDISTETIWSGHTDQNGNFDTGNIQWDDCDPVCDDPDIYLRWECDTAIVNVQDANDILEEDWSWSTEDNTHDDFTGSFIDFGTLKPADSGQMPILHIHNSITRAHRWIRFKSGSGINTDQVDVQWPEDESGSGAYHIGFFDEIYISPSRQWHEATHTHEYGHHFLDEYAVNDGTDYCNGICDDEANDDCGHCMWCQETSLDAFNEGWPNWLADIVTRNYPLEYTFSDGTPYTAVVPRPQETVQQCGEDDTFHDPFMTEGFLGAMLRDIEDADSDPMPVTVGDFNVVERQDCIALGSDEIFDTVLNFQVSTPQGFLNAFILNYPQHWPRLYPTLRNIATEFVDGFPADTQPPGVVQEVVSSSHPIGDGSPLPCIVLDWDTPPDDVTGGRSYSVDWDSGPSGVPPDEEAEIVGSCVTVSLDAEPIGDYYISIRARDWTGKWSNNFGVYGPFTVTDCNSNGIVDVCEVNCAPNGVYDFLTCFGLDTLCALQADCGFEQDCNGNAAPDSCDIASGASSDCNENDVPDECENISHWDLESGLWSVGDSWREGTPPVDGNHVCIGVFPDTIMSTLDMGAFQVEILACDEDLTIATAGSPAAQLTLSQPSVIRGNLTLANNGTVLRPNARLDIEGLVTWTGSNVTSSARFAGTGETWAHSGITITGGVVHLDSHDLYLEGQSVVQSNGRIDYLGDSSITIRPGATFDYQSSNFGITGGFTGAFVNLGTFLKTVSANTMHISVLTQNSGLMHVETGTLQLSRLSDNSGSFIADAGAVLEFIGGGHEFLPSSSIVAETVRFPSGIAGTNNFRGLYNVSGSTTVTTSTTFTDEANVISYGANFTSSGTATLDAVLGKTIEFDNVFGGIISFNSGDPIIAENLSLTGFGVIQGISTITVNEQLTWGAGTTFRGPGILNVNGQMNVGPGGGQKSLVDRILNVSGEVIFNGAFGLNGSAVVNNLATGVMDLRIDGNLMTSESPLFNNAGTVIKTAGSGTSSIFPNTANTGRIESSIGTLQFRRLTQTAGEVLLNGGDFAMYQISTPQPLQLMGGVLRGSGTVTGVVNNTSASVEPGLSVGAIHISGNYTQGAVATLTIEVGGPNPGEYDVLDVSGTATLAGELNVAFLPAYTPVAGDSFVVLTAGIRNGLFDQIVSPIPLAAEYDATSLLLTVLVSKGDLDFDGRLTLRDVAAFQRCFQGAGFAPPIECTLPVNSDFDGDGDVDLDDFATVYPADFTGP
jgi:hypothetical protein